MVLVGLAGRTRAPGVDHHELSAPRTQRSQAAAHIRGGHQAAVGGQRVGAQDQQVIGAVDIGDRDDVPVPNISAQDICLGNWSTVLAE